MVQMRCPLSKDRVAVIVIFCIVVGAAVAAGWWQRDNLRWWAAYRWESGLKSDEFLRQSFEEDYEVLNEIRQMLDQDEDVLFITPDTSRMRDDSGDSRNTTAISKERLERYRVLLKTASLENGIVHSGSGTYFIVCEGACPYARYVQKGRGYVYTDAPLSRIVSRLNDTREEGDGYIHLRGNWYLFQSNMCY